MSAKIININIPRVETYHNDEYIRNAFKPVFEIESIEFNKKKNSKGQKYNGAVIMVKQWFNPEDEIFRALDSDNEYKYKHSPKYHWVLMKHSAPTDSKPDCGMTEDEHAIYKKNPHMYIMRAETYHTEDYIRKAFEAEAIIASIRFIEKKNTKGQTYNGAVILVKKWLNKRSDLYQAVGTNTEYRFKHNAQYHWLINTHVEESLLDMDDFDEIEFNTYSELLQKIHKPYLNIV